VAEKFYSILTLLGEDEYADAQAENSAVQLTHMALGDSNGSYYEPDKNQTALVNEVYRGAISYGTTTVEGRPGWVQAELRIPVSEGGWTVREVGLYSSTGNLFAVGKFPVTDKPLVADGAPKELIIKMIFKVTNTSAITLVIDPSIAYAKIADIEAHDQLDGAHWILETATVARVSGTQFTVVGDKTGIYTKNRAVFFDQTTDAYGHVASAPTYSEGTGLTTVTVRGCVIDSGLFAVKRGQKVAHAPKIYDDHYAVSSGSANAYNVTLNPALKEYVPGMFLSFKANFSNSSAATVNFSGVGDLAIKKNGSTALVSGDIVSGQIVMGFPDGNGNFQLVNGSLGYLSDVLALQARVGDIKGYNKYTDRNGTNIITLTVDQKGSLIDHANAGNSTYADLPSAAACGAGSKFRFMCGASGAALTIRKTGSDTLRLPDNTVQSYFYINYLDTIELVSDGVDRWILCGGSNINAYCYSARNTTFGFGQTWVSVSRTAGQSYTNSSGKPIAIAIRPAGGNFNNISLYIGGYLIQQCETGSSGGYIPLFGIVPPGGSWYYVCNSGAVSAVLQFG
jgi:hypothetical protein